MTKNLLLRSTYKEAELDEFHNVEYRGKIYPLRRFEFGVYGVVDVSIASLEIALSNEGGSIKYGEAERIDNGIFFYVEDDKITLPLDELKRAIADSL